MILSVLEHLSKSLLLPVDQITAALCLLLAFPFAFLLHFAIFSGKSHPCHRLVTWLSIAPTYLFLWISFYVARPSASETDRISGFIWDVLSVHFPVILFYFGLKHSAFIRRNPTLLFVLLLVQLSYHHLSRQLHFYNQYTVNMTGPLMILSIKLSAFAYNVHDGEIDMGKVDFEGFAGWCLLFAGFFTGPVVSFNDYENFCLNRRAILKQKSENSSEDSDSTDYSNLNKAQMKGRKRRATFLLLSAALLLLLGLILQPHFPTQNLLQVSESASNSLLYKIVFMHLSLLTWRIKYYVAWSLAEGALVIIGLGFTGAKDNNKVKWNKYQNVNFLVIESTCDFRTIIAEWNVSTNRWLNQYIYQRLGRTFKANLSTYLVSALWHGFYPGYYVTFVSGALYTALTRLIYKSVTWPLKQKYRRPLLYIPNYLLVDYFAAPFALQTFADSWKFSKAWGFYGHICLLVGFIALKLTGKSKSKKQ